MFCEQESHDKCHQKSIKPCLVRDKTLNMCFHGCILQLHLKSVGARGRGNLYDKKRKVLHIAYCLCKEANSTVGNETSCWTDGDIQRMSLDVHFLMVEAW